MPCTRHRVFLATLIVAAKYLNDSSPKNKHWAGFAKLFDPAEINLMEKQLLFLLDYDLRFDEAEAIVHFAPFMNRRTDAKETRAAAVTRVKARVQAHVSLPPTPPHDVVSRSPRPASPTPASIASATSGVQSLVKRLSSTYLSISGNTVARPRPLSRASSSSTLGTSSASGDSETGSLTSSSGYSSPATSVSSISETEDIKDGTLIDASDKPFVLGPVPTHAVRQGRKVSTASVCTIKGESGRGAISPSTSLQRVTLDVELQRSLAMPVPMGRGTGKRALSQNLNHSHSSGGFLSRMFGSGQKTQAQDKEAYLDCSDSQEGLSTLRRLTSSKSTLFRGQQSQAPATEV
jgi:PHO85 cyclin-1